MDSAQVSVPSATAATTGPTAPHLSSSGPRGRALQPGASMGSFPGMHFLGLGDKNLPLRTLQDS